MIDTILFDLDGTLVNSLWDIGDSVNYTMRSLGYSERTIDEIRGFVGNGAEKLIERALPDNKKDDFNRAMVIYKESYNKNLCNKTKPYEKIFELIEELKSKGVKIGVVTNKPDGAAKIVCDTLFKGYIKAVVGADISKRRKKPESDGVDYCLKILGSSRDRAVYIGDSEVDLATAENANMICIGVSWGFRDRSVLEKADYIADTVDELKSILMELLSDK